MRTMQIEWKLIRDIFLSFAKIGPVTFGGGYAMIPLIEKEVVVRRRWVKEKEVADVFAIAESIPGAIAINSATFIGYKVAGILGAVAAMIGVMVPSFFIVLGLSVFYLFVRDNPYVAAAFQGIKPAIVALIAYAGYKIGLTAAVDKTTMTVIPLGAGFMLLFHQYVHPVLFIASGVVIGILIVKIRTALKLRTKFDKTDFEPLTDSDRNMDQSA